MALVLAVLTTMLSGCAPHVPVSAPPGGVVLTLFVRNASETAAQFDIELGPDRGAAKGFSFGKTIGIACNGIPAGSRVVLEDGQAAGGAPPPIKLVVLDAPAGGPDLLRWVDIDAGGNATLGQGVPNWWSGPPTC